MFVDGHARWAEACRTKAGAREVHLVNHTGTRNSHLMRMRTLARDDAGVHKSMLGTMNETERRAYEKFVDTAYIALNASVIGNGTAPFDVIVVDGPQGHKHGRVQSLFTAVRLAQSYAPAHFTHLFLHDAARGAEIEAANTLLGHAPARYLGNTLPRKGLKHWRVPGEGMALPPR